MTGNFSRTPTDALAEAQGKGYAGVHIEQGVPVLDRDLNLLGDIVAGAMRQALQNHVGDGTAGTSDFAIAATADPLDFTIRAGTFLVGGVSVTLAADTTYRGQTVVATASPPGPPPLLTQPVAGQPNPRIDTVYLDAWIDEIDDNVATGDTTLGNSLDVGMRTSTRSMPRFLVRVAENAADPPPAVAGHVNTKLAQISRPAGGAAPKLTDLRSSRLTLAKALLRVSAIEAALGPIIYAVEPNDVIPGQPNPITVIGRNLDLGGAKVMMGPTPAVVASPTRAEVLTLGIPANAQPGTWPLTVQTAMGIATAPAPIKIEPPPPKPTFALPGGALAQIAPSHATVGALLTLNGSNFTGVKQVAFNSAPAVTAVSPGDLVSVTDAVIQVKVPALLSGAVGSQVTLTVTVDGTPATTTTSDAQFKIDPQPVPQPKWGGIGGQIAPPTATRGVTTIVLSGQNFGTSTATTTVRFTAPGDGSTLFATAAAGDFQSVTPTKISMKAPLGLTIPAAFANQCSLVVVVQGASPSLPSNDLLTVT